MDKNLLPVLVVGNGLAALSVALFLAWRGVPVALAGSDEGGAAPQAVLACEGRTMELFRALGLEAAILRAARDSGPACADSPCVGLTINRHDLAALLHAKAIALGVEIVDAAQALQLPSARRLSVPGDSAIEAAWNLAWRLAAVHAGVSSPALLDGCDEVPAAPADGGRPGTRAPHLWIANGAAQISTLDLFPRAWLFLAADGRWRPAAEVAVEQLGIELGYLRLGVDIWSAEPAALRAAFGLRKGGAVLVSPHGVVAWRAVDLADDPLRAFIPALARLACSVRPGAFESAD